MKKYSLTLLAMACSFALVGCSSSRGGDSVNTSKYLTEKPTVSTPTNPNSGSQNSNTSPSETKPAETKPTETKPAETKPTDTTKPTESKPAETKPVETKPTETKPTETKPTETKPTETKPAETKPADTNLTETTKPAETKPAETAVVSPLNQNLFVASSDGTLSGAVVTLNANGTSESRNPINNGKEMLNELIIGDNRLVLFNTNDLLNGNGMDGFKALSNNDAAKETPISATVSGYVGGWGSESSYNPSEFRNMRFGIANVGSDSHLFVQGYLTPTDGVQVGRNGEHYPMPREGKVLYEKGYALYGKDGSYQQLTAEVEANFSDKKIGVKLKEGDTEKLAFNGVIEGNSFSGKTNGVESKGAFYGSRAAEVGGVFYQTEGADKGKNGVFGAVDKRFIR